MFAEQLALFQYEGTKIVTVGLVSGGFILTGKRRDNGKWTNPGGHVDEGEDIVQAAIREVQEEAGITVQNEQLEFICAKKVEKGRGGFPFVVYCYLAHVDREKATAKHDPDKEIETWKWVPIRTDTPELQEDVRHAKEDTILLHFGVNRPMEARLSKLSAMEEQSKKIRTAGVNESPEDPKIPQKGDKGDLPPKKGMEGILKATPSVPEPRPKTPAEMTLDPDAFLPEEEVTGDAPKDQRVPTDAGVKS